ncbi:MAG: hypothetical protein U5O39_03395 [Gammaproteobacteria bacterium]|nr:hypothetical protein [Gammaproteobacteria bacterium]
MAKKQNVFERAAQAVVDGTPDQCGKLIDELNGLIAKESPEMDSCRPHGEQQIGGGGVLPAGERFQAAALAGEDTAAIEARYNALGARIAQAYDLVAQLKQRRKDESERLDREAAPDKAQQILDSLDQITDEFEAAQQILSETRARLNRAMQDLARCR